METALIIAYSAWAAYSGYKWLNGRIPWLEEPKLLNRICKILAILLVGYVIGGFYLIWLIIKLALRVVQGF